MKTAAAIVVPVLALALLPSCTEDSPAEITIASTPSGATVTLDGAALGTTPYTMKVKTSTVVTVSAPGHAPQELTVAPGGEPNLVVKLAPAATPASPAAPTEAETTAAAAGGAAPVAEKKLPRQTTLARLKAAYKAGKIDRNQYDQRARQIKHKRDAQLDRLKTQYKAGRIDRGEHDRRKRVIVNRYNGD